MPDIRKRLGSFFKSQKATSSSQERGEKDKAAERPPKGPADQIKGEETTITPAPAAPINPPQAENSGASSNLDQFEGSPLFWEIKNNIATAKAPWTGKPISFETTAWDHRPSEPDFLPPGTLEELNEGYTYIRLANRLVWLSEDLGRSSQEIQDNYLKMCKNIAERLDKARSLAASGKEQALEAQGTAVAAVERSPKLEDTVAAKTMEQRPELEETIAERATEQPSKPEETITGRATEPAPEPRMAMSAKDTEQEPEQEITAAAKVEADRKAKEKKREKDSAKSNASLAVDEAERQQFRGVIKLQIAQGAQGAQISNLMNLLTETQEIKVLSSGGAVGQRSWVILSTERALPLLQILRKIPIVKSAAKLGNDIEVTLVNS